MRILNGRTRAKRSTPQPSLVIALAFLDRVWSSHPRGFVFLAALTESGVWIEKGFHAKFGRRAMEQFIRDHDPGTHDLYYCPNAFSHRRRLAKFALSTKWALCDIDGADPAAFRPQPTILVETSPGRHQGLWEFDSAVESEHAEVVSRQLTDTYHGDKGGWSSTKMLRLPGTFNHKRAYDRPLVRIVRDSGRAISTWPQVVSRSKRRIVSAEIDPTRFDPHSVIKTYRKLLAPNRLRLMEHMSVQSRDRSKIIFMIVGALHDAGASPDEIAAVLWRSPYFISKHGADLIRLKEEMNRILNKIGD
jgi:hypothetical protein